MAKNSQLFINVGQGLSIATGLPTISSWDSETRPKNVKRGTLGFNTQTQRLEYWDGKKWFVAEMAP